MRKFDLNYHIIDRCNKNCIACGHYAPLAPKEDNGVTVEDFRKDLELCGFLRPYIKKFYITGGEPTLHENLKEIIEVATDWFDNVWVTTNGISLDFIRNNVDFINKTGVHFILTNYSFARVQEAANILGYVENFCIPRLDDGNGNRIKFNTQQISRKIVNPTLRQCNRGECVHYRYGKLYMCQIAANLHILKNYFKDEVSEFTTDGTFIDLNETQDLETIEKLLFLDSPKLCEHCNEPFYQKGLKDNTKTLCASKKLLSEWIEDA